MIFKEEVTLAKDSVHGNMQAKFFLKVVLKEDIHFLCGKANLSCGCRSKESLCTLWACILVQNVCMLFVSGLVLAVIVEEWNPFVHATRIAQSCMILVCCLW